MKIHIIGASGAGSTTLGQVLAQSLNWTHLDADEYYWQKTNPPYTIKIPLEERNSTITKDFEATKNVILSGSMISWGSQWLQAFDLVVFLYVPPAIRIARLEKREYERYGSVLETDPHRAEQYKAFIDWAKKYDDPDFEGRSITQHNIWLQKLSCPVLRIEGDTTVSERILLVSKKIEQLSNPEA